jgi:EAL domain-containing protein (putative c-di-GMP-specific phosphodiesterase class I)
VIIALTAHVVGSAADAWRDAGMDDVLHKPFTLASMAKMLGRFLTAGEPPARPAIEAIAPAGVSAFTDAANVDSELIDPEVAAQLAAMAGAGRAAFVEKVHGLYRENAPESVLNLVKAIDAGEPAAAAKAAHALKSMSYNVGARLVAKLAAEIEASSREGALPAREKAFELKAALERTLPALGAAQPVAAAAAPVVIPSTPMDEQTRTLLEDLEAGLDRGEFSLAYQPQVDRDGVRIIGAETLIRWAHPTRGPVSPALFIPIAEEHGLIGRVTTWVLDRLLTEARDIDLPIAFNASAIEFAVPGFVERLQGQIERHGSDPRRLEVEITETAILQNEAQVRENMNRLREYGLRIALDDFGAGYSSLGHLRRYPFDKLKIDREFITDCSRDVESATIVHAVVSIGRALGMKVIAEGVETETQRKFLKVAGVHAMQGYLFGKPVAADVLAEMVAAPPSPRAQAQAG